MNGTANAQPPTGAGRCVLVTGAAKRIGREIALEMARAGWNVAVHYHASATDAQQTVRDCQDLGADAAGFAADLGQEPQARGLVPRVVERFGRLDAVVNSASIFELDRSGDFRWASLQRHMDANVAAPVTLARALHEHVRAARRTACAVNLLDQKLWNVNPDFLSYSMSKAALQMATQMLAQELAPTTRLCGVAPGLTYPSYLQSPDDFRRTARHSLSGQATSPQDVARAVRFAIETPSVNGTTLLVDAGQHLVPLARDVSFL